LSPKIAQSNVHFILFAYLVLQHRSDHDDTLNRFPEISGDNNHDIDTDQAGK